MNHNWTLFIDLGLIAGTLLFATAIRAKVKFFQTFLIPNALTAGFILLPFYNFLAPLLKLDTEGLGALVYHLLAISFVAMTLRKSPARKRSKTILATSATVLSQYGVQALIGLLITFIFMKTVLPNLFPAFGWLLPLGFSLGPSQAFSIGERWEAAPFLFNGASTLGLSVATIGYLLACFGGIFLINYGIRKGWVSRQEIGFLEKGKARTGIHEKGSDLPAGSHLTTDSDAIDSMSFNIAVVFGTYFISYLLLQLLTFVLSFAGEQGMQLAESFWAINFVFSALTALVVKKVLNVIGAEYVLDNGSLTRISGASVDVMVAAAIGAISLAIVIQNLLPLLILCLFGGIITFFMVPWLSSRLFEDYKFQRMMIIYGAATGTMSTGLALLRVVDPNFETPAASDFMYSTGLTFVLAIPFILSINLPARSASTGNQLYFWLALAVSAGYTVFSLAIYALISRRRSIANPLSFWLNSKTD